MVVNQKNRIFAQEKIYAYMTKRLLIISLAGLLTAFAPQEVLASEIESVAVEQTEDQVEVSVEGQTAYVTGAQGNIPKGCYILKVGKVVRKIQVH